jgi:hypothetical protein
MQKPERKILSLAAYLAVVLLAMPPGVKAQSAGEAEEQKPVQEQQAPDNHQAREQVPEKSPATAPARRAVPHVTGTVTRITPSRIDLKTPEGKVQKVAVNEGTEWLVDAREGSEVKVEYRRKVSGFVIAERVLPAAEEGAAAAQPGKGTAPGQNARAVTGSVVSWNNTALVLRTEAGDVTLFLSPSTEYLVKSLDPGLRVNVEYEGSDRAKVATRVLAVKARDEDSAKKNKENESGSE